MAFSSNKKMASSVILSKANCMMENGVNLCKVNYKLSNVPQRHGGHKVIFFVILVGNLFCNTTRLTFDYLTILSYFRAANL